MLEDNGWQQMNDKLVTTDGWQWTKDMALAQSAGLEKVEQMKLRSNMLNMAGWSPTWICEVIRISSYDSNNIALDEKWLEK